ncbi:MAG: acyl carrier protein [Vicinamibacterales bacterium]
MTGFSRDQVEKDILAELTAVAREHLGRAAPITRETRLVEELSLDSIRLLTLIVEVENRFRLRLDDEDTGALETAGDLVDVIRNRRDSMVS